MARIVLFFSLLLIGAGMSAGDLHVLYIGGDFTWQVRTSKFFLRNIVGDYKLDTSNVTVMAEEGFRHPSFQSYNVYGSSIADLKNITDSLQNVLTEDDLLLVYIFTHGYGYVSFKESRYVQNGWCRSGFVDINTGDELEYHESNWKVRALLAYSDIKKTIGLNEWAMNFSYDFKKDRIKWHRFKFISNEKKLLLDDGTYFKDKDIYIEKVMDYLVADTNKDGFLDKEEQKSSGLSRYNMSKITEADWGLPDEVIQDVGYDHKPKFLKNEKVFLADCNLDGKLEAVVQKRGDRLTNRNCLIVGNDFDNDGVFDRFDFNLDGDFDDSLGVDEYLKLGNKEMLVDDSLASIFSVLEKPRLLFFFNSCFSAGYINDLAGKNRAVLVASLEEEYAYSSYFSNMFWSKMRVFRNENDLNNDGVVGLVEAFLAMRDQMNMSTPAMNVNGCKVDGSSSEYLIEQFNWNLENYKQ